MLEDVVGVAVVCGMCGRFWTPVHARKQWVQWVMSPADSKLQMVQVLHQCSKTRWALPDCRMSVLLQYK